MSKSIVISIVVFVVSCIQGATLLSAQDRQSYTTSSSMTKDSYTYTNASDAVIFPSAGVGVGIPYGLIGARVGPAFQYMEFTGGVGIVPFDWSTAFTIAGTVYFTHRTSIVRPKLTAAYSNAVALAAIVNEDDVFDPLFSKVYDGFAGFFGIDWRFGKTSSFSVEIGIGAVVPIVGIDKINEDLEKQKEELERRGYVLDNVSKARSFPLFSIGIIYNPGRAMKLKITDN